MGLNIIRKLGYERVYLPNCTRYNQSLSDLLHQWNAEKMTLSYAGPELAIPISQTAIYPEENCDLCAEILVSL